MGFLFTSESVSEGHPDKVSDQISDAILDEFLRRDANSKVACETLCTTGLVVVAGEVRSEAYVDVQGVARRVIDRIGYTKSEYAAITKYKDTDPYDLSDLSHDLAWKEARARIKDNPQKNLITIIDIARAGKANKEMIDYIREKQIVRNALS